MNNSHPFYSIIIPTFNAAGSIQACLDSIIQQTCFDYEVWVIDGCSNDSTVALLHQFENICPQLNFISEKDKGIYDALNKGIQRAKGEWIICLGSDDILYDTTVLFNAKQWMQFNVGEKMVYGDVNIFGDNHWAKDGHVYDGIFTLKKLIHKNICQQAIFYHHSVFKELGLFNEKYFICADWDFNLKCFSRYQPKYINLVIARFSAGGLSSTFQKNDDFLTYDFVDNCAQYFNVSIFNQLFKQHFQVLLNKAIWYYNQHQWRKSLQHFLAAVYHAKKPIYLIKVYVRKTIFNFL